MTMWLIQTIATSAVAVLISVLFIWRLDRPRTESAGDIEAYLDQLTKVESELRRGLIDDAGADAARLEIKKRALTAGREQGVMPRLSAGERNFALICVTGIVVLGAAGLYVVTRNSDPSSMPVSGAAQRAPASFAEDPPAVERLAAVTQTPTSESQGQPRRQSGLPSVEEMIQRLAARLEKNPKDGEGWRTLGWSDFKIGRFPEAGEAYAKAIELNPNNTEIRTARIEALVRSADGTVTTDAKNAIEDTLKIDPQNARARFFEALAKEQGGDKTAALADWVKLLGETKPSEPWMPELKSRIRKLERDLGVDAAAPMQGPKSAMASGLGEVVQTLDRSQTPPAMEKGPSPQDVQAAEVMSLADRSAMIRGMVDGLAWRLEKSPRDADGWIKLIRSRMVLGETRQAKQALYQSIGIFADDIQQRDRIIAAARELGLDQ
jgi:cytochrome c-type biogenesis protein CcmH